jgi:taurine dioxygenase
MSTTYIPEAAISRPSSEEFRVRRLAPAIGAEIIGVDLSKPMDDEVFAKILDVWHQNLVILFRDQHLTEDDQVRFGQRCVSRHRTPL